MPKRSINEEQSFISKRRKVNYLPLIPIELLQIIFSYVSCCYRPIFRLVCKQFKEACDNDTSGIIGNEPEECDGSGLFRGPHHITDSFMGWMLYNFGGCLFSHEGRLQGHGRLVSMFVLLGMSDRVDQLRGACRDESLDGMTEYFEYNSNSLSKFAMGCAKYKSKKVITWMMDKMPFGERIHYSFSRDIMKSFVDIKDAQTFEWFYNNWDKEFTKSMGLQAAETQQLEILKAVFDITKRRRCFRQNWANDSDYVSSAITGGSLEMMEWFFDTLKLDPNMTILMGIYENKIISLFDYAISHGRFDIAEMIKARGSVGDHSGADGLRIMCVKRGTLDDLKEASRRGYKLPCDILKYSLESRELEKIRWLVKMGK